MADPVTPTTPLSGVVSNILNRAKVVLSPFPFGLSDDDNLRITSVCSVTGVALETHYRLLSKDGSVKPGRFQTTTTSNRVATTTDFPMSGGFVTNLTVFATAGSPQIGQVFVIVQIIRGIGATAIVLGTMLQGYVTTTQGLGWPGSAVVSSTEGEPAIRTIVGTTPSFGVNILETVPSGARWEVLAVAHTVLYGPVANFPLQFEGLDPGGNLIAGVYSQHNYPGGGVTYPVCWSAGNNSPYSNTSPPRTAMYGGMPTPLILRPGGAFRVINTGNVITLSAPIYSVREWLEVG